MRMTQYLKPLGEDVDRSDKSHAHLPPHGAPPGVDGVIRATNDVLLRKGVISRALSPLEVWAVTDFHVPGQPGGFGAGIALEYLARHLDPLQLEDYFTYDFFGSAGQPLPDRLAGAEHTLLQRSDRHGLLFASRWRKC